MRPNKRRGLRLFFFHDLGPKVFGILGVEFLAGDLADVRIEHFRYFLSFRALVPFDGLIIADPGQNVKRFFKSF